MRAAYGNVEEKHVHIPHLQKLMEQPGITRVPYRPVPGFHDVPAAITALPGVFLLPIMDRWGYHDFRFADPDRGVILSNYNAIAADGYTLKPGSNRRRSNERGLETPIQDLRCFLAEVISICVRIEHRVSPGDLLRFDG